MTFADFVLAIACWETVKWLDRKLWQFVDRRKKVREGVR